MPLPGRGHSLVKDDSSSSYTCPFPEDVAATAAAAAAALLCREPVPDRALARVDFFALAGILRMKFRGPVGFASARLKRPSEEAPEKRECGRADAAAFLGMGGSTGKMGRSGWSSVAWISRLTSSFGGSPER